MTDRLCPFVEAPPSSTEKEEAKKEGGEGLRWKDIPHFLPFNRAAHCGDDTLAHARQMLGRGPCCRPPLPDQARVHTYFKCIKNVHPSEHSTRSHLNSHHNAHLTSITPPSDKARQLPELEHRRPKPILDMSNTHLWSRVSTRSLCRVTAAAAMRPRTTLLSDTAASQGTC